jgi:hypothetical protein
MCAVGVKALNKLTSEADISLVNHVSLLGGEGYACCMFGTTLSCETFLQYMQLAKRYTASTLDLYSGVATAITAGCLKVFCGFIQ